MARVSLQLALAVALAVTAAVTAFVAAAAGATDATGMPVGDRYPCCDAYTPACGQLLSSCREDGEERYFCCPNDASMVMVGNCECWCTGAGACPAISTPLEAPTAVLVFAQAQRARQTAEKSTRGLATSTALGADASELRSDVPSWVDAYGLDDYDSDDETANGDRAWPFDRDDWPADSDFAVGGDGGSQSDAGATGACRRLRNGLAFGPVTLDELGVRPRRFGWLNEIDVGETLTVPIYAGAFFNDVERGYLVGSATIVHDRTSRTVSVAATSVDGDDRFYRLQVYVGATPPKNGPVFAVGRAQHLRPSRSCPVRDGAHWPALRQAMGRGRGHLHHLRLGAPRAADGAADAGPDRPDRGPDARCLCAHRLEPRVWPAHPR